MIITLSGTFGSGGFEIAKKLSEELGYKIFTKEIVEKAAEIAGADLKSSTGRVYDEDMDRLDEDNSYSKVLLKLQFDTLPEYVSEEYNKGTSMVERFKQADANRKAVMEAIEEAGGNNCIFVGRCAGYFLRDDPNTIRLFTIDHCLDNVKRRVRALFPDISDSEMIRLIKITNKRRSDYLEYLTQEDMYNMANYDYIFNTGYIGDDATIELIKDIISKREQLLG